MKSLVRRRLTSATLTIVLLALFAYWLKWRESSLARVSFDSGYVLIGSLLFLAMYNVRKKLPVLPWTTSAAWLQAHLYVGLATAVLFGLHVNWRVPDGSFEVLLTGLYLATFLSGLLGIYWTRTLPQRLARVSEEVIYQRIPILRNQLREKAQQAVLDTVRSAGATTLGEFYSSHLHAYFEKPRGLAYFLRPNSRLRRRLLAELTEMDRYLSEPEREAAEQLFALVRRRDDLDYHAALQLRLKAWLFIHIALTYPLLAAATLHGVLVHLFDGGSP